VSTQDRGMRRLLACGATVGLMMFSAACGDDDNSSNAAPASTAAADTNSSADASSSVDAAKKQLEEAYAGRYTEPPANPNPAAASKTVWFISPGQASPNAAATWVAAKEAGEAIGWNMKLFDSKLDQSNFSKGIRQAVGSGADGIISMAIDCPQTKAALKEAGAAGVETVSLLGFDCNDADPNDKPLFSSQISLGDRYPNWPDAYRQWGADQAAWAIAKDEGKTSLLNFVNGEYLILQFMQEGIEARMKECAECEVNNVEWTLSEVGPKVSAKVEASLLKQPETTALSADANPQVGFSTGVMQAGKNGKVKVFGGLGLPSDIQLLKEAKGLDAVPAWPVDWWSWAAVDTLNSVFNGKKADDSGLGWQLIDRDTNLPEGDAFEPKVDFRAAYKTRWGVS
jgi:ribose transport system substrate-binding protein